MGWQHHHMLPEFSIDIAWVAAKLLIKQRIKTIIKYKVKFIKFIIAIYG